MPDLQCTSNFHTPIIYLDAYAYNTSQAGNFQHSYTYSIPHQYQPIEAPFMYMMYPNVQSYDHNKCEYKQYWIAHFYKQACRASLTYNSFGHVLRDVVRETVVDIVGNYWNLLTDAIVYIINKVGFQLRPPRRGAYAKLDSFKSKTAVLLVLASPGNW